MKKTLDLDKNQNLTSLEVGTYDEITSRDGLRSQLFESKWPYVKMSVWVKLHELLKSDGKLQIKKINVPDFLSAMSRINGLFLLVAEDENNELTFVKSNEMRPEIVTPDELNELLRKAKPVNQLFQHTNLDMQTCQIIKKTNKVILGSGMEGTVYYIPKWRSDVVVKIAENIHRYIPNHDPEMIVEQNLVKKSYESENTESLSNSLLNDLTTGQSNQGFSLHVQRTAGFFTCIENQSYDLVMLNEKMDGDLKTFFKKFYKHFETNNVSNGDFKMFKAMVWQALFAIVSLNELGWLHQDASLHNFLVKKVSKDDTFLGNDIFSPSHWLYKLDNRSWKVSNVHMIVKIADFGWTIHTKNPKISTSKYAPDEYRMTQDEMQKGSDVNYFLACLAYYAKNESWKRDIENFFQYWFKLLDLEGIPDITDSIQNWTENDPRNLEDILTSALRLEKKYDNWDTLAILDAPFFEGVVEKLN